MRCKNCGWPNKPNVTTCVKCHTPLVAEEDSEISFDNSSNNQPDENLKRTVSEEEAFGSRNSPQDRDVRYETPTEPEETSKPCPKCGYPLRPGTEKCPNCKFQVNGYSQSSYGHSDSEFKKSRPTRMDYGNNNNLRGTVNPFFTPMDIGVEPTFVLKPVKRANERHELEEIELTGETVSLNRDNTEPNNLSITSKEQAVITNVDGQWFIEDKSELKTTFVQASRRIELKDGDLILLGNRLFEFHE